MVWPVPEAAEAADVTVAASLDEVGIDVAAHINRGSLMDYIKLRPGLNISDAMIRLSDAGYYGRKNKKGFFKYDAKSVDQYAKEMQQALKKVKNETNLRLYVASGREEAEFSANGVLLGWPDASGLVCDKAVLKWSRNQVNVSEEVSGLPDMWAAEEENLSITASASPCLISSSSLRKPSIS